MLTIFHIFRILIFIVIVVIGFWLGFYFYGFTGVILSILPSALLGAFITNIIVLLEREMTLYLMSKKSISALEEYIKSDGIGRKYLAFVEMNKRKTDLASYEYIVEDLLQSENPNERQLAESLKKSFY